MPFQLDLVPAVTALFTALATFLVVRYLRPSPSVRAIASDEMIDLSPRRANAAPANAIKKLTAAFPSKVTIPSNEAGLAQFQSGYWAQQCAEAVPSCSVRPETAADVAKVIEILHEEHVARQHITSEHGYFFALRSGGHSHYASALGNGIIVDLSAFNTVEVSQDSKTVTIGCGARWGNITEALEAQGLAVLGGRDAKVGAGGLVLGGGISFLSPRYGFVSSNVISFEVILASGKIVNASATEHPDLWRALKGGSNNFGVVTRFTLPTAPSNKVWAGFIHLPGFETRKTLTALHEWNIRDSLGARELQYDENAASPLGCFAYLQNLRLHAHAVYLLHTKPKENQSGWPTSFKSSPFRSLWRYWSTSKVQPLSSALEELSITNPNGRRQIWATTTFVSELATLHAAYDIHLEAVEAVRNTKAVKGLTWNFVTQPILPQWASKGEPGPMGFTKSDNKPLMLVCFACGWDRKEDDHVINSETRRAIEKIEAMARSRKTDHPYRYLNYCGSWQKPFEGYGEENHQFLQEMSKKYDEQGLFQESCAGTFKLTSKES